VRTTNAIERLHEEFKRSIKTQTVLPCAATAAMLFWALLASGQITMRKGRWLANSRRQAMRIAATAPIIESVPSIRLLLAQHPFNGLHNWHLEILFIVAIIIQLIHIVLEALWINNPVVACGMIVTT
jgi:hypothetical protein